MWLKEWLVTHTIPYEILPEKNLLAGKVVVVICKPY